MNVFAAKRAVGVMEVLCWGTRDSGVGGKGQGTANKSGCIVAPLPTLQPLVLKEGETPHREQLLPHWVSLGR